MFLFKVFSEQILTSCHSTKASCEEIQLKRAICPMIPCIIMKGEKKSIDKGIINTLHRCLKVRFRLPPINKWSNRTTETTVWQTFKHKHIVWGGGESTKESLPLSSPAAHPLLPSSCKGSQSIASPPEKHTRKKNRGRQIMRKRANLQTEESADPV